MPSAAVGATDGDLSESGDGLVGETVDGVTGEDGLVGETVDGVTGEDASSGDEGTSTPDGESDESAGEWVDDGGADTASNDSDVLEADACVDAVGSNCDGGDGDEIVHTNACLEPLGQDLSLNLAVNGSIVDTLEGGQTCPASNGTDAGSSVPAPPSNPLSSAIDDGTETLDNQTAGSVNDSQLPSNPVTSAVTNETTANDSVLEADACVDGAGSNCITGDADEILHAFACLEPLGQDVLVNLALDGSGLDDVTVATDCPTDDSTDGGDGGDGGDGDDGSESGDGDDGGDGSDGGDGIDGGDGDDGIDGGDGDDGSDGGDGADGSDGDDTDEGGVGDGGDGTDDAGGDGDESSGTQDDDGSDGAGDGGEGTGGSGTGGDDVGGDDASAPGVDENGNVTVVDSEIRPGTLPVGEPVFGNATLENTNGDGSETVVARLTVDGDVVASETVTIPAGDTRSVSFEHTFEEPGEYDVAIEGGAERTVSVTDGSGSGPSDQGSTTLLGSAFGSNWVYLLLLAVAAAALISGIRLLRE